MISLERRVLDALPITVYAVDLEGRITLRNRSGSHGAPHLSDERAVVGAPIWEAITDPGVASQLRQALTTLSEGRSLFVSWELPRSSATEERMLLMQLSAITDGHIVTGYVVSTADIAPPSAAREMLVETSNALAQALSLDRVLQETSQQLRRTMAWDTIAIALSDGDDGDFRIAHQSGHAPEDLAQLEQRISRSGREARERRNMVTHATDDGIEITAPLIGSDNVLGAVTVSSAVNPAPQRLEETRGVLAMVVAEAAAAIERAMLVQRLGHRRRLEAIGEVSAGVARELRNPLFGISSAAQLLRFRVKDDPVVEKNVGRILREVERMNSMVASLLEYGRPNPVHLSAGDPDVVWDDVIEDQRGRLESKALLLHRSRSEGVRCAIDAQQLTQVFVNVLVNAVDAAPEGSDLTLETMLLPSGAWRCRLHNRGQAIPPDVLPRVFEMFFSTKPGGTGIGLALCQRIIDAHDGSIALESVPDVGTSVTIVLPPA